MRILSFTIENFKKIRFVEITPKGRVIQITGRNGQGKSSVLDALWSLFGGKKAIPEKPVRRGAEKSRLAATLGDDNGKPLLIAKRTIQGDRTTTLSIEAAPGCERPIGTPQAVLDALIGEMSFDPIAFINMDPKQQINVLRAAVKMDLDVDALNEANAIDFQTRTMVNKEVTRLRADLAGIVIQDGLPKERVDEVAILERINETAETNRLAQAIDKAKTELERKWHLAAERATQNRRYIEDHMRTVQNLRIQLAEAETVLRNLEAAAPSIEKESLRAKEVFDTAPIGEMADVGALTQELQQAQLINRELDKRDRSERIEKQLHAEEKKAGALTRAMDERNERKREAIAGAKMPIEGLTFDENAVAYNGLPLNQLGEAEQIRIATTIAMATNPKLRAVPIHRGESLDDEALALIEALAEENNFQIFMAKVDTSGAVGIVMHDGAVEKDNQ
jgi:hypothetical protein